MLCMHSTIQLSTVSELGHAQVSHLKLLLKLEIIVCLKDTVAILTIYQTHHRMLCNTTSNTTACHTYL